MSDYKEQAQLLADEKAEELYGKDFYSLPPEIQHRLYTQGLDEWRDRQIARAESMRDE